MCGIAVVVGANQPRLDLAGLAHRGPDGSGVWESPNRRVWLGHTRLAILDLSSAAAQPMAGADGRRIVFNGEIYNHTELRASLGRRDWRTTSDTETLLAAYGEWGPSMLHRLRGMFAFAIYDPTTDTLFAARDRFGIKPLYYRLDERGLALCSHASALTTQKIPDRTAIADVLAWGSCRDERVVWRDVSCLPAGHYMQVAADGHVDIACYWPTTAEPSPAGTDSGPVRARSGNGQPAPAQHVRSLLESSVSEHLLSDVPVASLLSGGIDSTIVTTLAARASSTRLVTFTVGFPGWSGDESAVAASIARRVGTDHHRIELTVDEVLEWVPDAVRSMDLPSADGINTYIVARAIAERGIKVALSGLGADELFGGYPSFRDVPRLRLLRMMPKPARRLLMALHPERSRLSELPMGSVSELARWRRKLWTDEMIVAAGLKPPSLEHGCPPPWTTSTEAQVSWTELTCYMRDTLLRDSDQMSMASSVEMRVPFLDHRLVEYVLALPAEVRGRYAGHKGLLVSAFADVIPAEVTQRPKQGFCLPIDQWLRGPLSSFAREGLRHLVEMDVLPPPALESVANDFQRGRTTGSRLWALVVLGHYVNRFQDQPGAKDHEIASVHSDA